MKHAIIQNSKNLKLCSPYNKHKGRYKYVDWYPFEHYVPSEYIREYSSVGIRGFDFRNFDEYDKNGCQE